MAHLNLPLFGIRLQKWQPFKALIPDLAFAALAYHGTEPISGRRHARRQKEA
jgi:hypothetical protein